MVVMPFLLLALTSPAEMEAPASAEVCGRCHRAIQEAWKTSAHAQAMESRLFQDALDVAETRFGAAARRTCLKCHAPVAVETGDLNLRKKTSWEGVTCDYCHSITGVSTAGSNPRAVVAFSMVKSGPIKDAESMAHGTTYSALHTSAEICASCHEYRNSLGFPVLTTYSEWKNTRYGKDGKACQSCHMYRTAGAVVDPKVKRSSDPVNLHQMPGSHSIEQLTKTISAQLSTSREGNRLRVNVVVANRAAGHYVPTGSPLRQLILEVRADSFDGRHFHEERVYRRTVADQRGTTIDQEHLAFMTAARVVGDTRLAPDEKRTESFLFEIPPGTQTQVSATLRYFYSPFARTESQKRVTFLSMSRLVR
ncbi:MAG TPA: multiheme c-type cytochrome [Bryobacteraceae bacterium]|nr:multiheme c-type cytochrome [Bryobacteraceae bacterium]